MGAKIQKSGMIFNKAIKRNIEKKKSCTFARLNHFLTKSIAYEITA